MPFEYQPNLISDLVRLRPLQDNDWSDLFAVACDPQIWLQHPASNRYTATAFRHFFSDAMASGGALIVIDSSTDAVIGSSRYYGFNEQKRDVEIGWSFLARSHWGGQYNAEIKRLMLEHAFKYVDTVIFYIDPANRRSQKSVEKIGAMRDSLPDNQGRVVYRITRPDYDAKQ